MTQLNTKIAFPNSIALIMDFESGIPPKELGQKLVTATESCVAIGTAGEYDKETEVFLSDEDMPQLSGQVPVFDGRIKLSSGYVSVVTAQNKNILSLAVKKSEVSIRISANDTSEPDRIWISVS